MLQLDREDKAKELLAGTGFTPETPINMEIRFNTSETHSNIAVAIQEQPKPLGVEASLINTDGAMHFGHLESKGDFDIVRAA